MIKKNTMKDEEIQKQIGELIDYEMKRQIVEGVHTDSNYFKILELPLEPKLKNLNRFKEILNRKNVKRLRTRPKNNLGTTPRDQRETQRKASARGKH